MVRFLAISLLVACVPAYAAPVSVVVVGVQNQYDDPNGLLPFPQPDDATPWVLTFTYDSETPDINPDPIAGEYRGAITTISLSIGNNTFQPFADNSVLVLNDNGNPDDGYSDLWIASTFEDAPLRPSFGLILINFGASALSSDALVTPSWPYPPWGFGMIDYSIYDRSSPDPGDWRSTAVAAARVTSIAVVPIPATFWLLGTACLGAMGWRWRRSPG